MSGTLTINGMSAGLVSGEKVRNEMDIDFTQGGNDGIYPFYIPKSEIWIDDALHGLDRTATALHEMVERDLMVTPALGGPTAQPLDVAAVLVSIGMMGLFLRIVWPNAARAPQPA